MTNPEAVVLVGPHGRVFWGTAGDTEEWCISEYYLNGAETWDVEEYKQRGYKFERVFTASAIIAYIKGIDTYYPENIDYELSDWIRDLEND